MKLRRYGGSNSSKSYGSGRRLQKVLITARKQSLAEEESQRSDRKAIGYNRFVNSVKYSGGRAQLLQRKYVLDNTHVYG